MRENQFDTPAAHKVLEGECGKISVIRLRRTRFESECGKSAWVCSVSVKGNLISSACLSYRLRVRRLCSLNEYHPVLCKSFLGTGLWSLAVSLWFDGLECYEHLTKD